MEGKGRGFFLPWRFGCLSVYDQAAAPLLLLLRSLLASLLLLLALDFLNFPAETYIMYIVHTLYGIFKCTAFNWISISQQEQ